MDFYITFHGLARYKSDISVDGRSVSFQHESNLE